MAIDLQSSISLLLLLHAGFNYSTLAQKPDDTETFCKYPYQLQKGRGKMADPQINENVFNIIESCLTEAEFYLKGSGTLQDFALHC